MSNARQILALLESRASGDDDAFFAIALQIAASEARQGRKTNAEDLRAAVEKARRIEAESASHIRLGGVDGTMAQLLEHREPRFALKDVVLADVLKEQLQNFTGQQLKRDWLREHGRRPNRRLLFVGPPGSGKTITAEAVASALRLNLYVVRLDGLVTKYLGETGAKLRALFDEASTRRGVFFFDEFDAIGGRRDSSSDIGEMRRVLNGFLQAIEEDHATDSPIIAATNHPELLDDALHRRFDLVLRFDPPTDEQVKVILKASLRPLKFARPAWKRIMAAARGLSQAELVRSGDEVVKTAILEERQRTTSDEIIAKLEERRAMRATFGHRGGEVAE